MSFVILIDMREYNGYILPILEKESSAMAEFKTKEEAEQIIAKHIFGKFPRLIIDTDLSE